MSIAARTRRLMARLCLLALAAFLVAAGAFWCTGGRWYVVRTPSMGTAAPVGTLVLTRPTPLADLHVGDVIAFHPPTEPSATYTHRIVAIEHGLVHTRGDINGAGDPWALSSRNIVGRAVTIVPRLGWLVRALPLLAVGNLVIFALTALWTRAERRGPLRMGGAGLVFALAAWVLHPFTDVVSLQTATEPDGRAAITVVSTGLLPVRVSPVTGHGHATPVDLSTGQVGVSRLSGGVPGHQYLLDTGLHLDATGWSILALIWLLPLLWTLLVGYRPEPDPPAHIVTAGATAMVPA